MSAPRWHEELKDLPALSLSELASDPVRLLLVGMAASEGLSVQQWLDLRLRSLAVMALPGAVREAVLSRHSISSWGRSHTPIDYVALSSPSSPTDVPDDECFWSGVKVMADEIKASIEAIRLARLQATAAASHNQHHRLWQAPAHDRAKTFATNDGRQSWHKQLKEMGPDRDIVWGKVKESAAAQALSLIHI